MSDQPGEEEPYVSPSADLVPYYRAWLVEEGDGDYDPHWGPNDYAPDDEDNAAEEYRRRVPVFDCHYDPEKRMWVCDCARFIMYGACLHSYRFRGETVVKVSKDYL